MHTVFWSDQLKGQEHIVNALGMQGRMSIKYIFNITGSDDSKCVYPPQNMVLMADCRHHSNKRSEFLQGERSSWIDDNTGSLRLSDLRLSYNPHFRTI